jgi:thiamine monophosphate kinase
MAHRIPQPPLALGPWLQQHKLASAAQDLSDSLSQVSLQLAAASEVGLRLDFRNYPFASELRHFADAIRDANGEIVIRSAMNPAGVELRYRSLAELLLAQAEDYELLFTSAAAVTTQLKNAPARLTKLGVVAEGADSTYIDEIGAEHPLLPKGFEHL